MSRFIHGDSMRAGLATPVYLSISWVLTVSYQLFTDTAVRSLASYFSLSSQTISVWLNSNIDVIIFVYAFTWIFVLSSVIPSVLLGKERSIFMQYIVVLILTLLAFYMKDILQSFAGFKIQQLLEAAYILQNPALAVIYLSAPYLLMIGLDVRSRKARKKKEKNRTESPIEESSAKIPKAPTKLSGQQLG
jgi:hypothetical protein